jgi:hypothetical protein
LKLTHKKKWDNDSQAKQARFLSYHSQLLIMSESVKNYDHKELLIKLMQ